MITGAVCTTAGHKLMRTITGHVQRVLGHVIDPAAAGWGIEMIANIVGLYSQLDGWLLNITNTVSVNYTSFQVLWKLYVF